MSYEKEHTEEAKKERGEVFTPETLCEEMLGKLPDVFFTSAEKTILDNSCGNGNFLVKSLEWRLKHGVPFLDAISTLYGVELDEKNATECRQRLSRGSKDKATWDILNRNIICADALDELHPGWDEVGYMWNGNGEEQVQRRRLKETREKAAEAKKKKTETDTGAAQMFLDLDT
jgi:hypothetical protein